MSETIILIAVFATVCGAILSTLKGYFGSLAENKQYKVSRLISSIIIAVMTSLAVINFDILKDSITSLGIVGLIVVQLVIGFGTDQGLSKLDK